MNRIAITISALFGFLIGSAQHFADNELTHHSNLTENSISIGLGIPYSFEINTVGANIRAYYNIGESICFGTEFSFFKNGEYQIVDFDFIGHYIFETRWVGIYPLIGANFTIERMEHSSGLNNETNESLGIVFGAGLHRNFKKITLFTEYSRVELGIEDQFFTVGVMYTFK